MKWNKSGKIFEPDGSLPWWKSHCMAPTAVSIDSDTIRVFMGCWDEKGISRIGFIDVDSKDPKKIRHVCDRPIVDLGEPGTFDDNGVFPGHAHFINGKVHLFFTGFQLQDKIRFTNFGGLAVSTDDRFLNYRKVGRVPILDRSEVGTCVRSGQSCILENGKYRTWYSAGSKWLNVGGKSRQTYDAYYCESDDITNFPRTDRLCLARDESVEHGLGRPQVLRTKDGVYRMLYTRRILDMHYTIGYSTSRDGLNWDRKDDSIGISHSKEGWDSEMVYFPSVVETQDKTYLFYCGNGFGATGLGFAVLDSWD